MLRIIGFIVGLVIAAMGGTIAYRALFIEPRAAVVVTETGAVRELPDYLRVASGIIMLIIGAALAFFAARRKPM